MVKGKWSHSVMSNSLRLPGSPVHGLFQARKVEWVAISFSRGSSPPGIKPSSPAMQADSLLSEPPGRCGEAALPQWISWSPKYWDSCTCQQTGFPTHLIRLLGTQVPSFWREKAKRKEKCFNSSIEVVSQIVIKNWSISCHISKARISQASAIPALQMWIPEP